MENLLNDNDAQVTPKRPTFLTVLCILTFIGSGWGLISSCMQYFTADKNAEVIAAATRQASDELQKVDSSNPGVQINNALINSLSRFTPESYKHAALGSLAAAVFCLLGAFIMWGLKKNGFYLYVIGTLIGIAVPFIIFGNSILALGSSAVIGFFGILFVVLYGVNLKHMR